MIRTRKWGWIPLLAMLALPLVWVVLSCLWPAGNAPVFTGNVHYLRLALEDVSLRRLIINTYLFPAIGMLLVSVVAVTLKKCVVEAAAAPRTAWPFYVATGAALLAVGEQLSIGSDGLTSVLSVYADGAMTDAASVLIRLLPLWILMSLWLLLIYVADRVIPARKRLAPVVGISRGFSVAHFLLHLCFGSVFGVALVRSFFFTFSEITTDGLEFHSDALWEQDQPLLMALYACGVVAVVLLLIAELVFGAWFMVKGSRWSGIAVVAASAVVMLSMLLTPPQALLTSLYLMLRFGFGLGINLVDTPVATVLAHYRLFHLLALLCCVTAVWLRWPRTAKKQGEGNVDA